MSKHLTLKQRLAFSVFQNEIKHPESAFKTI